MYIPQSKSNSVNVVCNRSPSRILIVLLISFGMTTLPRSSIGVPVAFMYIFLLLMQIVMLLRANASNKVHSGVKFFKFGNAVWFLLFVRKGKLYCVIWFLKLIFCQQRSCKKTISPAKAYKSRKIKYQNRCKSRKINFTTFFYSYTNLIQDSNRISILIAERF